MWICTRKIGQACAIFFSACIFWNGMYSDGSLRWLQVAMWSWDFDYRARLISKNGSSYPSLTARVRARRQYFTDAKALCTGLYFTPNIWSGDKVYNAVLSQAMLRSILKTGGDGKSEPSCGLPTLSLNILNKIHSFLINLMGIKLYHFSAPLFALVQTVSLK